MEEGRNGGQGLALGGAVEAMKGEEQSRAYYDEFRIDESDPPAIFCWDGDEKGFDELRLYKGRPIEGWPEGIPFVEDLYRTSNSTRTCSRSSM